MYLSHAAEASIRLAIWWAGVFESAGDMGAIISRSSLSTSLASTLGVVHSGPFSSTTLRLGCDGLFYVPVISERSLKTVQFADEPKKENMRERRNSSS